jgi:hypothetical protein
VKRSRSGVVCLVAAAALLLPVAGAGAATLSATIDFEGLAEGASGGPLSSGSGISGDAIGGVVGVAGATPAFGTDTQAAMIFDATCTPGGTPASCTGGDSDLFHPTNGNILILSEDLDSSDPDDTDLAGSFVTFSFDRFGPGAVTVTELTLFDTEEAGGTIELQTTSGTQTIEIPAIGDGQKQVLPIGVSGVVLMTVTFAGSGAVDNVRLEVEEPDQPGGGEGCTPGYWKQAQHFDSWTGFSQSDLYEAVFGVDASFPATFTLLDALGQGGGGEKALGRHAVAALLNAANDGVNFAFTTAEVIAIVQQAYATGDFEAAKDRLAAENELGCLLN